MGVERSAHTYTSSRCCGRKRSDSSDLAEWKFIPHMYMNYARAAHRDCSAVAFFWSSRPANVVTHTIFCFCIYVFLHSVFIHTSFRICWEFAARVICSLGVVLNIFDFWCGWMCVGFVCASSVCVTTVLVSYLWIFFALLFLFAQPHDTYTCCLSLTTAAEMSKKKKKKKNRTSEKRRKKWNEQWCLAVAVGDANAFPFVLLCLWTAWSLHRPIIYMPTYLRFLTRYAFFWFSI